MIIECNDCLDRLRFSGIIVILILRKIYREDWPLHFWGIIQGYLLDYAHMIITDLLWPLDYMTLTSLALLYIYLTSLVLLCICYCHCLYYPVIMMQIIFTICHWYSWYWFLVMYTELHYFALVLINKINQAGVTGRDYSRRNSGRCAWKGDPLWIWMTHVILLFMHAPIITCYMIPEYSELFLPAIRIH